MTAPTWEEMAIREAAATRLKEAKGLAAMHLAHGVTEGKHCGDCAHLVVSPYETADRYYKCIKYRVSSSAATDWRKKWDACGLFAEVMKG